MESPGARSGDEAPAPGRYDARMPGPLDGIRVVDFSAIISGPLAAMLLADQGADVIKVEAPDRPDLLRKESFYRGGLSALFINVNRGKRAIALDLQDPRGLEVAHALCRRADIVIENYRPGVAARLGIGPEALHALNPHLIYCHLSGYGQTGPSASKRAYDPVIQGTTGYVATQINPEVPIPDLVRNTVVDKATSYTAAQAITAALFARERGKGPGGDGSGQVIEVSLLDAGLAYFWPDGMIKHTLQGEDIIPGPALYERYRLTETKDGHIVMWAGGDNEWHGVFRALDHPEWIEDERFATGRARQAHGEVLGKLLYDAFRQFTSTELLERMERFEVPGGPVLPLDEIGDDAQIRHNAAIYATEHPSAGRMQQARPAARFSTTQAEPGAIAPLIGEHSDAVLGELGYDATAISDLREAGVVR